MWSNAQSTTNTKWIYIILACHFTLTLSHTRLSIDLISFVHCSDIEFDSIHSQWQNCIVWFILFLEDTLSFVLILKCVNGMRARLWEIKIVNSHFIKSQLKFICNKKTNKGLLLKLRPQSKWQKQTNFKCPKQK